MAMLNGADVRQMFLDFFKSKRHQIVPSASIVIKNDPTLLFTNAGMNQFKDFFLGNRKSPYSRVADTQKCLRVSGKHNDLEEVGVDTYHHTMFEMLGNWSFGDYFKKEAIAWSWELLTEVYKIDKNCLYVTIFEGDEKENLPRDDEAIKEWKKVIDEGRIINGNKKDNFWEMGDTGPCGPCTEIHVDCRSDEERNAVDGKTLVNKDHPQVIEIWNNVFMEFNRIWEPEKGGASELSLWEKEHEAWILSVDKKLIEKFIKGRAEKHRELTLLVALPAKHVDTGMGFERLVRVLQNKQSNYDTDVFTGTIEATQNICNIKYEFSDSKKDIAFRVIADHIRAIAFTIADGQLPFNTGAGYVVRRILRRAVRYYYSYFEYKQPLLFQLIPILSKQFENVFPELQKQVDFVSKVVMEEEQGFLRTLGKGIVLYTQYIDSKIKISKIFSQIKEGEKFPLVTSETFEEKFIVDGKFAFELYDTYGFPLDLTQLLAKEEDFTVDVDGFNTEMQQQKNRSRTATLLETGDWIVLDDFALNEFVGYDSLKVKSKIVKYRKVKAKGKEAYQIVLEASPFYAESGGQVGDTGELTIGNSVLHVTDTKKENDLIIHFTDKFPDEFAEEVIARVDIERRKAIAAHHSATHLLHAALRKVLGTHVAQKGSLVNEEHLRFDFSHFTKVTDEEIKQIELIVNQKIRENIRVDTKEMIKDEAVSLDAMALFGEKYGDRVRVVIINLDYSVELCGGTHVSNTGELGFFKIKHEAAVAAGVRRIEAVAGKAAEEYLINELKLLQQIQQVFKNPKDLNRAIENLITENAELKKRAEGAEAKQLASSKKELTQKIKEVNGTNFIGEVIEASSAEYLKKLCYELKTEMNNGIIILAANIAGKAQVTLLIDDNLSNTKNLYANEIIKQYIAPLIKGGGGGQKNFATAGGQNANNLQSVIDKVKSLL